MNIKFDESRFRCPNPSCKKKSLKAEYYNFKTIYFCDKCGYKKVNMKHLEFIVIIFLIGLILLYL